jgi:lipoprotein-anchoring transpeptidase ErfK/SrfK
MVRVAVVGLLALVLTAGPGMTGVALATGRGPIVGNVTIAGVNLQGSDETSVTAFIVGHVKMPYLPRLPVVAASKGFSFDPRASIKVDVAKMVDLAYAAGDTTVTISPKFVTDWGGIRNWVVSAARKSNHGPVNAHYYVTKRRALGLIKEVSGETVSIKAATNVIACTLIWEAETSLRPRHGVRLPVLYTSAKITFRHGLNKAILVVLSRRHLTLYAGSKIQASYACAIGQPAYPTPKGVWTIIDKNPAPSWNNPGSAWARNMPSHIGPGASNPLGLRALYLNASGIRIHGTQNIGSIGTPASHGCIRVANANIVKLYPKVPIGTTVFIVK